MISVETKLPRVALKLTLYRQSLVALSLSVKLAHKSDFRKHYIYPKWMLYLPQFLLLLSLVVFFFLIWCTLSKFLCLLLLCTLEIECWDHHHHRHHYLSLNRKGHWGTTDDFTTSFLHFSQFSTALWDLANSRPVHSLMLSSHLFLCLPCLLPPFTVPCKMILARPVVVWSCLPFIRSGPPKCWDRICL